MLPFLNNKIGNQASTVTETIKRESDSPEKVEDIDIISDLKLIHSLIESKTGEDLMLAKELVKSAIEELQKGNK